MLIVISITRLLTVIDTINHSGVVGLYCSVLGPSAFCQVRSYIFYKPVGDRTPRLAQMSLPWQQWSAPCSSPLVGPNMSGLGYLAYKPTYRRFCRKIAQICPNFVAMATRIGPQHCTWFHWIGHPRKPPSRRKHLRSICHTSRVIGDFVQVQILGSKFWALEGLNQKSKK